MEYIKAEGEAEECQIIRQAFQKKSLYYALSGGENENVGHHSEGEEKFADAHVVHESGEVSHMQKTTLKQAPSTDELLDHYGSKEPGHISNIEYPKLHLRSLKCRI